MTKFLLVTAMLFAFVHAGHAEAASQQQKKKAAPAAAQTGGKTKAAATEPYDVDPFTKMQFVLVKGGCFKMGDTFGDGDADEQPVHEVCVSDFYLGKYEVTGAQWEKVMKSNPTLDQQCGPDCPVDRVSWKMAQDFISKLNAKSGRRYRLPTEAEWEYAARSGGKEEKWAGTNEEASLGEYALYSGNRTVARLPGGSKKPNGIGLYDMSGNVMEWCQDRYSDSYYAISPRENPPGPAAGERRVVRGGGPYGIREVRTTERHSDPADMQDSDYGFRLMLPAK